MQLGESNINRCYCFNPPIKQGSSIRGGNTLAVDVEEELHGQGGHEHGEDALDLMRSLKMAFDPHNILNPGKMLEPRA